MDFFSEKYNLTKDQAIKRLGALSSGSLAVAGLADLGYTSLSFLGCAVYVGWVTATGRNPLATVSGDNPEDQLYKTLRIMAVLMGSYAVLHGTINMAIGAVSSSPELQEGIQQAATGVAAIGFTSTWYLND